MPDKIPFLDHSLKLYQDHVEGWKREERRLYGGDAVLSELLRWKAEEDDYYNARLRQAGYLTFPKLHATTLTGHLSRQTPIPELTQLGGVRERKAIDRKTLGELFYYNCDGIGDDGQELPAWIDGVQERALATGFRWVLVEAPATQTLTEIRRLRRLQGTAIQSPLIDREDVLAGYRPYLVEYSPISVPFWQITQGRLDFAVIRISVTPPSVLEESGEAKLEENGYYLLVRNGFKGLGTKWSAGGWWKFAADYTEVATGTWDRTRGQVPLFPFIGESSPGTVERPAIARSLTMEIGQIAVNLMNRMSERDWNVSYAAKAINWILGIGKAEHALTVEQHESGSIVVGVPPVMFQDGTVGIPQMWNSSAAAMDMAAFTALIEAGIGAAREVMVRQVTSEPGSSGESKLAGFSEASSPLLARLAATRQQAINTILHFTLLRFGVENPAASITIPRDFDLQPVVEDINRMMGMLKRSWLRSPTWERELLIRAGDETGTLPEDQDKRAQIEKELDESGKIPTEPVSPLEEDQPEIPGRRGVKAEGEEAA